MVLSKADLKDIVTGRPSYSISGVSVSSHDVVLPARSTNGMLSLLTTRDRAASSSFGTSSRFSDILVEESHFCLMVISRFLLSKLWLLFFIIIMYSVDVG